MSEPSVEQLNKSMNLNDYAATCHAANIKWWQNPETGAPVERNRGELLMLIVSEIAEAMEGERKNLMDDKLPHRRMAEVEMADALIRIFDFCGGFKIELKLTEANEFLWLPDNKGSALLSIVQSIVTTKPHLDSGGDGAGYYLADCASYIASYCRKHGYDLWGALEEKMRFNATRADHQHEARLAANGKKF